MITFKEDGKEYLLERGRSCWVSRSGKEDASLYRRSDWGYRDPKTGHQWQRVAVWAAESGECLRKDEALPESVTPERLKQLGLLTKGNDDGR